MQRWHHFNLDPTFGRDPNFDKIYIGFTSDLDQPLLSHNKLAIKGYTVKYRPWELVYKETYEDKSVAMKREKQLKGSKGRKFIWSMINKE